jgi:hypothetical protein
MEQLIFQGEGWPLVQESVLFIEQMFKKPIEALGKALGDSVIIHGVENDNGVVSAGYILHNGELLPFMAGNLGANVVIVEETTEAGYDTEGTGNYTDQAPIWKKRYAKFGLAGTGVENVAFADFERLQNLHAKPQFLKTGKMIKNQNTFAVTGDFVSVEDITSDYVSAGGFEWFRINFETLSRDYFPLITSADNSVNNTLGVSVIERNPESLVIRVNGGSQNYVGNLLISLIG